VVEEAMVNMPIFFGVTLHMTFLEFIGAVCVVFIAIFVVLGVIIGVTTGGK
jgi:hypothetical protein